jgi:LmbE family N-acetylglucosaminyl deacetylase
MRIMAFEAHPDDIEHFCAGTLAKYRAMVMTWRSSV